MVFAAREARLVAWLNTKAARDDMWGERPISEAGFMPCIIAWAQRRGDARPCISIKCVSPTRRQLTAARRLRRATFDLAASEQYLFRAIEIRFDRLKSILGQMNTLGDAINSFAR